MIELRLLGSVDLNGPEGETLRSVLAQPKRVALLAYLAVARSNGFHRRDKLLGLFWPESDQERGRGALRKAVYLLRQSLGEEVIVSRGDEEIGLPDGAVWCDAVAFEEALNADEPERALELYGGDLLEGFYVAEAPEFERWLEVERERLRGRASDAAWTLAEREEAEGSSVHAASWAKKAVSFSPDDEGGFRRLLELLDRVGDRAGAMKEYESFARRLSDEYEGEPSPETQALIAAIRERDVSARDGTAESPVESPAGMRQAPVRESVPVALPSEPHREARPVSLFRVLTTYAVVSLAVLVAVHIFTLQLGLPGWFFPSAVVVLLVCLPIIMATALVQGATYSARGAGAGAKAPSAAARRWLTWRNAVGVAVVAFAVLGLAVTGYMAMRVMGIGPWGTLIGKGVLEERDAIVLADFEDHAGDSILALTVTEGIRVRLEQSAVVRVADDDHVGRVLQQMERDRGTPLTNDVAREVAIRAGLKAVVTGEVNPAGSGYVVSARLVAAESGETLGSFLETAADPDAIMKAVDRLSAHLRERIGESLKSVQGSPPLSQAQTASLEALRLFTQGYRANLQGEPTRAVDLFSRAIEIDTAFAGAYAVRAIALANSHMDPAQRIADLTHAYELRHRLSPAWRRYHIEGLYHLVVNHDREKTIEAWRTVLELRPDAAGTLNDLGALYLNMSEYARAEELFRRRLEIDSLAGVSWDNLAWALFNQGKSDEAWETLRQFEAKMPDHPDIPSTRAHFASAQCDYEAAELYLIRLRELHPDWQASTYRRMGWLDQVQGKLAEAEGHFLDAMSFSEEDGRSTGYISTAIELASLQVGLRGDTTGALKTVAEAIQRYPLDSIEPLERPYAALAGFYAFAGAPERARQWLLEWDSVAPPSSPLTRGEVALAEGRTDDALDSFWWVQEHGSCGICGLSELARGYELAGQRDSALAIYERYVTTPWIWRLGSDALHLAWTYERLGELYEQRGDTAKAIYYYGKLVDLWKDADPELQPRVEAARRAIEALSPDR